MKKLVHGNVFKKKVSHGPPRCSCGAPRERARRFTRIDELFFLDERSPRSVDFKPLSDCWTSVITSATTTKSCLPKKVCLLKKKASCKKSRNGFLITSLEVGLGGGGDYARCGMTICNCSASPIQNKSMNASHVQFARSPCHVIIIIQVIIITDSEIPKSGLLVILFLFLVLVLVLFLL